MTRYAKNRERLLLEKIESQKKLFANKQEGMDFVKCHYCEMTATDLTSHISRIHKIKASEYTKTHPLRAQAYLKGQSERIAGSKNPAYQHNGRLSPFSDKFFKGTTNVQATKEKAKRNKQILKKDTTKLDYWLVKTNGNLTEATKLLSERQATFSLKKCIQKHGEDVGREIWSKRQEKWLKNYKKQNYSQVSQKLFNQIMQNYVSETVYFATWERTDMTEYMNKEYRLKLKSGKSVLPDFIDIQSKKIIEFDGTYWHRQTISNPLREKEREDMLIQNSYMVLRIPEADYKKNPQLCVQKCLNFLTQ
jgi:very-short-patch-repair endonuclease